MANNPLKKISTRLLLSYSVPLLCLAGLGTTAYISAQKTFDLEAKREQIDHAEHAASGAAYYLTDAARKAKGYVLEPDRESYTAMYSNSYQPFLSELDELLELSAEDEALMPMVAELSAEGERINRLARQIFTALRANDIATARTLALDLDSSNIETPRESIETYLGNQLEENAKQFKQAQTNLARTLLLGTAIASIVTLALGLVLAQQLRRQMRKMVNVVEHNGILVTTSSTQIAASSRQLEASVTEQVASTAEITATAKEIATTADELTQTVSRVVSLSDTTAATASEGQQDLERMATTIQQLIKATATISSKLSQIDDKANNISAVVTTITKVADQTNLLSLNAAIEAEKAGEYGAGFSVVAREIRRLADQTAIATLDIENIVKEMLSSVSTGVMEMDKFSQNVGENANSISQISEQMTQIICQVQSLVPQFEAVRAGMSAQAEGAVQIRSAMEQLNDSSQQTADSVRDTNQVIVQLGDVARDLQGEVAQFKLAV